jgi:hypothetical protein
VWFAITARRRFGVPGSLGEGFDVRGQLRLEKRDVKARGDEEATDWWYPVCSQAPSHPPVRTGADGPGLPWSPVRALKAGGGGHR